MTDSTGRGFDGLSEFSTDVDGAIAKADRIASGPRPAPAPAPAPVTPSTPVHSDGGAFTGGLKKVGGWILAIGLLLAIKACIFGGVRAVSDSDSTSPSYSTSSSWDQTGESVTDMNDPDSMTDNMTAVDEGAGTPTIGEALDAADAGTSTTEEEAQEDDGALDKPLPGYSTLSISEVRYCLAEDMRIAAQKTELDSLQYSDVDRFNRNVDGFNDAVNDYNRRCVNRSIMSNDRPLAASQVEQKRSQLETEGRNRVQ
ncbi:hypothetical protein GCM10011380_31720 [Sphingomonas metalli]|uniref:Uncharacterized protein n=1 Tax=Sphingomonas metalli TaxID=1779358 RepID=A0A916WWN7_9SPHN|nr:hypothetical protein [Sphingomonas metalli]GGB39859.1 hypothetical protein GCM10011380_31720 [Sphingomonas metalli]